MSEKELFGNSEQLDDTISRQWLMECVDEGWIKFDTEKDKNIYIHLVRDIAPSAQPVPTYQTCSNALLKMWMDNVLTDGEYNRIMDKLNAWKGEQNE